MGSSGAGKTSLLNMLRDKISLKGGAALSGKVMINGTQSLDQISSETLEHTSCKITSYINPLLQEKH
jgi:ABC-type multidrug transport system ATPase subunit